MRYLYQKYGGTDSNYTLTEIQDRLTELNGESQSDFFDKYVNGVNKIPLEKYLTMAGLLTTTEDNKLKMIKKERLTLEN